jgi:hypothetical protein
MRAFDELDLLNAMAMRVSAAANSGRAAANFPSVEYMRKWISDSSTDNAIVARSTLSSSADRNTEVIELLDDALGKRSMSWDPGNADRVQTPRAVKNFATIADISKSFTLNERQHLAVKAIGTALLRRWKNAETLVYLEGDLSKALKSDQLRFSLGGEGGTGKSRVIDAIQALCTSWGHAECLVKTALTGKAATLIGGRTLASFLLQLRRRSSIDMLTTLNMIVIDEISMMKRSQLAELDKLQRTAKHVPDVQFGGVHIVLVGDFLQLPPVGADPLNRDPLFKTKG